MSTGWHHEEARRRSGRDGYWRWIHADRLVEVFSTVRVLVGSHCAGRMVNLGGGRRVSQTAVGSSAHRLPTSPHSQHLQVRGRDQNVGAEAGPETAYGVIEPECLGRSVGRGRDCPGDGQTNV